MEIERRVAELVREAFRIIKEAAPEDAEHTIDIIEAGSESEDPIVRGEWCYLLGMADVFNVLPSELVEMCEQPIGMEEG
jgi:hypothetical protein